MPGLARVWFGVFWIVVGLVLTGLSYAFPIFDQYAIFYGAWIFGGILVLLGLIEMAAWKLRGKGYQERRGAKIGVMTLIDTMCFVALSDGEASEEEIMEIHKVLAEDFKFEIELETVRKRVRDYNYTYDDYLNEFSMRSATIPADFKHEIVRAALCVAFADGHYSKQEAKACSDLIRDIGQLPPQTHDLINRVFPPAPETQSA